MPEAYEAVIMKCLEKQQDNRYQTMQELHDAILGVMQQLGITRDLPAADAAEVAAASGGAKTKSSPGTSANKTPSKPGPKPALPKRPSQPTQAQQQQQQQQQQTAYQRPPEPPPKPRTGLFVGLGVGGVAVIGAIIFFLMQSQAEENRKAAERAAHLAAERVAQEAREAAKKAEEAAKAQENEKVFLSVVSEPLGALVEATWKDGVKSGVTPFEMQVPKNVKVHFAFSKRDFVPYTTEVIADTAQVVKGPLQAEPRAPPQRVVRQREEESVKKAKPASDSKNADDPIPVEF